MISRIIQKKIFDIVFNIQKNFKLSNKMMYVIFSIWHHFQQLTCCLIILFNSNLLIMIFNLCALLGFLINFVFFKGCLITKLEQKLEKNNIIVGDMYMDILGIDKTYHNRLLTSKLVIVFLISIQLYKILVPRSMLHF